MIRDHLEVFREIMRDPRWKDHFDLVARALFDNVGNSLIGLLCSALNWGHLQQQLGLEVAIGVTQLYFDGTFMGARVGLDSVYLGSLLYIFFPPQKSTFFPQSIFYPLFLNEDGRIREKRLSQLHCRFRRYSTLPKTVLLESQYLQSYDDLLQILA